MRLRPAVHPFWFLAVLAPLLRAPVALAAPVAIVDPPATATSALTEAAAGDLNSQTWMSVDADCCAPTESLPKSWGGVKTLYR